jgi:hypothetical protein
LVPIGLVLVVSEEKIFEKVYEVRRTRGNTCPNFLGERVCNDEGYICYFLTEDEVGKFY